MPVVARGTVQDRPWGRTLSFVADRRFSGELVVDLDGKRYVVGFDHGAVVAAASPLATDAAVRVALTAGLVTSSQVADISRRVAARPDLDEVDAVAEAVRLGPDQTDRLRRRVIAHKAIRGFALDRGDFALTDDRSLPFDPAHAIDVRALIYLGARTHMTEQRLLQELARLGPGFQLRGEAIPALPQYGFGEAEKPVLAALRAAPVAVIDLDAAAPELDPRTVRAVTYALAVTNALDVAAASVAHDRARGADRPRKPSVPAAREVGSERTRRGTPPSVRDAPSERTRRARISSDVDFETRTPSAAIPIPRGSGSGPIPRARGASEPGARPRPATPAPADDGGTQRLPSGTAPSRTRTVSAAAPPVTSPASGRRPPSSPPTRARTGSDPPTSPPGRARSGSDPPATHGRPVRSGTEPPVRGRGTSLPPMDAVDARSHRRPVRRTSTGPTYDAPVAAEVRALIEERAHLLGDGADHYAMLGVPADAAPDAIRKTYFRLARQLHPDRLTALGITDDDRTAQRVFAQINAAFAVLSSPARRADYERTRLAGGEAAVRAQQDQAEAMARRILAAEEEFRIGEMALRRDQLDVAHEHFQRAVELNPDEADHHALLGWTIFAGAADKAAVAREARQMLERAATMAPKAVAPRLYLGRIARMMGRDREAMDLFTEVLRLSPRHPEAATELRLLESRQGPPREPDGGKAGLFSRRRKP